MSDELSRVRERLLALQEGEPVDPDPSPGELGALEGAAIEYSNGSRADLYEFASWDDANRAANEFNGGSRSAGKGRYVQAAANGAVLLVGSMEQPDPGDAGPMFKVGKLTSAFAGKE